MYGDSSPSFFTVTKWATHFKYGSASLEDEPNEGCPKTATPPVTVGKVHNMVLDNPRIKVQRIAETIGILKESVRHILHEELKGFVV